MVRKLSDKTDQLYYYNYQHKGSFSLPTAFGIWEVGQLFYLMFVFIKPDHRIFQIIPKIFFTSELRRKSRGRAVPIVPLLAGLQLLARRSRSANRGGFRRPEEACVHVDRICQDRRPYPG